MTNQEIKILAITACSGGGKGTCVKCLLKNCPDKFLFSISCTTRDQAEGEVDGKDYHFLKSKEEFKKKIDEGYFLEWEEVSGNYYGTPKSQYEEAQRTGKILLLDIDVKGGRRLKELFGDDILVVFINAGKNVDVYEKRIRERKRTSDTESSIQKRIKRIPEELPIGMEFEIILDNMYNEERFVRLIEDVLIDRILGFPVKI
ncbi:MAG: Guanylate kinase [Patescibacteria group bacterium]|nr:Guanylate kinase [Patescibacteria group bacterium]